MAKKIKCPSWLDDEAKKEWKRVVKLLEAENVDFTEKDITALEAYCMNYSKWKHCEKYLMDKGYSTNTPNGFEQQRIEVSISNKAQQELRAYQKELGLTPASRARMFKNEASGKKMTEDEKEMEGLIS